jgi:hypothetical protein
VSLSENIKIIHMPPKTRCNQWTRMCFDVLLCCMFKKLIAETDVNNELAVHEF